MKNFKNNLILILLLIVILGGFLRIYGIGSNPPSLTWDEAAWGYNAYTLGVDGKDEFGVFLPYKYLESFGDFKPPLYAYLAIVPIKIFGLNEFAVRLPSAIFGTLSIAVAYFLVLSIFEKTKQAKIIGLLTAFLLAISPWHIMLSRAAFEANVATFLLMCGIFFFIDSIKGRKWFLIVSAISFALSFYTFNTARIVAPLLVLLLAISFRKQLFINKKYTFFAGVIGFCMVLPLIPFLLSPQANLRYREVNIFSDITVIERTNRQIDNDSNLWWSKIIHNRRVTYSVEYLRHYFDNVSPKFLFIKGDGNPKFSTQDVGQMYIWEIPFLIIGTLFLFREKKGYWWILPLWFLLGIIPAATARETPHALRIETVLPTIQAFVAYGLYIGYQRLQFLRRIYIPVLTITIFSFFVYFIHGYVYHYPYMYSNEWQYGYKESISWVKDIQNNYDEIHITLDLGRPYAYYAFYAQTDPLEFRKQVKIHKDAFGFVTVNSFGKYFFTNDMRKKSNGKILYVASDDQAPEGAKILKTFYTLDGEPVLIAFEL